MFGLFAGFLRWVFVESVAFRGAFPMAEAMSRRLWLCGCCLRGCVTPGSFTDLSRCVFVLCMATRGQLPGRPGLSHHPKGNISGMQVYNPLLICRPVASAEAVSPYSRRIPAGVVFPRVPYSIPLVREVLRGCPTERYGGLRLR